MRLFELLQVKQKKRTTFENGEEFKYFIDNRYLLGKFNKFSFLYDSENNEFDIMRANIIIGALKNKETIELEVESLKSYGKDSDPEAFKEALKQRCIDLPYYSNNGLKIYIPLFTRAINEIYTNDPVLLLEEPYSDLKTNYIDSSIDPFDTYGAELFNSFFTSLVKIDSNGKEVAFFHYDTNTIYIITNQGRLEQKIVLFDKYLRKISTNHMLERVTPVVKRYFENDKEGFIKALFDSNLISEKLYNYIRKNNI
ncbi:MAG: hypothetical protein K6F07_03660 [Bacilli bacterium]|nr:hypothetical protein [Bacilli bacterium]